MMVAATHFVSRAILTVTDKDPDRAQRAALEMEERASQVLDRIEHMARLPTRRRHDDDGCYQ